MTGWNGSPMPTEAGGHRIPVVFAFDVDFAPYAALSAASLLAHKHRDLELYCITTGTTPDLRRTFDRLAQRYDSLIHFHEVGPSSFHAWKTDGHIKTATYFRLLIPTLINRSRVIYLDSDLVVTSSLDELYATGLSDTEWFAGHPDPVAARASRINLPPGDPYINAGVLVMDLDKLRRADFLAACREYYRDNGDAIVFHDQCIINGVGAGRKRPLESRWNVLMHAHDESSARAMVRAFDGRGVIHASGPVKPWMSWSPPWLTDIWRRYADLAGLDFNRLVIEPRSLQERDFKARRLEAAGRGQEAAVIWRELADEFWGAAWALYDQTWSGAETAGAAKREAIQELWDIWAHARTMDAPPEESAEQGGR